MVRKTPLAGPARCQPARRLLVASLVLLSSYVGINNSALAQSPAGGSGARLPLAFTADVYNVTVAECAGSNQCGRRIYVTSSIRMGIPLSVGSNDVGDTGRVCRYRITSAGHDRTWRVESRLVGGFCFLFMRIRVEGSGSAPVASNDLINRERVAEYDVHVRGEVADVDGALQSPTAILHVVISDVNDVSPLFDRPEYVATVSDGLPPFSEVARVRAIDSDVGVNADILYWLASHNDKFYIHPTSGAVHLASRLDAATEPELSVRIVAQNSNSTTAKGSVPQRGQATLRVKVRQANDWPPEFEMRPLLRITSLTPANTTVALLTVFDRDRGACGEIDHASVVLRSAQNLQSGSSSGNGSSHTTAGLPVGQLFALRRQGGSPATYGLVTARPLRDVAGFVNVTVQAQDRGSPPREGSTTLPLFVAAVVSAQESMRTVRVEVNETTLVPMPLLHIRSSERARIDGMACAYDIVRGNEGGWFSVSNASGVLILQKELDVDNGRTSDQLRVLVQVACRTTAAAAFGPGATERVFNNVGGNVVGGGGTAGDIWITETYDVVVQVLDCNDNAPSFDDRDKEVTVSEELPVGSTVLRVVANDIDRGDNGAITYSFVDPVGGLPFRLDATSGNVTLIEPLDYDRGRRRYWLRVRASDSGHPFRRETEAVYTVSVLNVNDNPPMFEKLSCSVALSSAMPVDSVLMMVSALDLDDHMTVEYQLSVAGSSGGHGGSSDCFAVDRVSGALRVTCSQTLSQGMTYGLELLATDGKHYSQPLPVRITVVDARLMNDRSVSLDCRDGSAKKMLDSALRESELNNPPSSLLPPRPAASMAVANREAPRIAAATGSSRSGGSSQLAVREDQPPGTVIGSFTALDTDSGYGGLVRYSIAAGNEEGRFLVSADRGELMVLAPLDRESTAAYRLTITAADTGQPVRSSMVTVAVQVLDANDNAPRFVQPSYAVTVSEATEPGAVVLRVAAIDPDEGENGRVTYELGSGNEGGAFAIDRTTGALSVRANLDRETRANYVLQVVARDGAREQRQLLASVAVTVTVSDVNDNSPTCRQPVTKIKVREDLPVGTVIGRMSASDPDLGEGGVVSYLWRGGISSSFGKFVIDRATGIVRIADDLDYEQRSVYMLSVRVRDGGVEKRESSCQLEVHVIDVNENLYAPQFDELVYDGSVKENSPDDTVVLRVTASDDDKAAADRVVFYSIRDGSGLGRFKIDDNGTIRTAVKLDRELQSSYWLLVYAQDGGTVPLASSVEVFIAVLDENDNAPRPDRNVYYASVPENHPGGVELVTIRAQDDDDSNQTSLSFAITGRNTQALFMVDSATGIVRTTRRRLDREVAAEHLLEVTINDNGLPPLSTTVLVIIKIEDENDETPVFQDRLSVINVPASHDHNMPVYQVYALDKDAGINGTVSYRLEPGSPAWLRLDGHTGELYVTDPLPQLPPSSAASVTVTATDGGPMPKSATKSLKIAVNDKPPFVAAIAQQLLRSDIALLMVQESDIVGSYEDTVRIKDKDSSGIFYAMTGGDGCFAIHPDRGDIFVSRVLDFETRVFYNLTISATDGVHTERMQLAVEIVDRSEFRPEFSQPVYSVTVSESIAVDTSVIRVTATDADATDIMHYSIHRAVLGSNAHLFRMDSTTGVMYTAGKLDYEETSRHELIVMVSDLKHPNPLFSYARVVIHVTDENDRSPTFLVKAMNATVLETAAVGTAIVQVTAHDQDKGINAEITYSIVAGNIGYTFDIDGQLGIVRLAKAIDLLFMKKYELVVRATDHGTPPHLCDMRVSVDVTPGEERLPIFTQSTYAAEVAENEPQGTLVTVLSPVSLTTVFYAIVDGTGRGLFSVDAHSGIVMTSAPLDYEKQNAYTVVVEASSIVGQSVRVTVAIAVLDRNDNRPEFLKATYVGRISEAAPDGSMVLGSDSAPLTVTARDRDSNLNSLLAYRIVEESARQLFAIDSRTGVVRTVVAPDREVQSMYQFTVQVSDQALDFVLAADETAAAASEPLLGRQNRPGEPSLTALEPATVVVHIDDVNDTPPSCDQNPLRAVLVLPTFAGVIVTTVHARDADEVGQLTYSLQPSSDSAAVAQMQQRGRFTVDTGTGAVRVAGGSGLVTAPVTWPTSSVGISMEVTVIVNDGVHSTACKVLVEQRASGGGLRFSQLGYEGEAPENSTAVHVVTTLQVVGLELNEPVLFELITERELFRIGRTSGVLSTQGLPLDREARRSYNLVVRATGIGNPPKLNQTVVTVRVTDVNDNTPTFTHMPYHATARMDASTYDIVTKVVALDSDEGQNGAVHYELVSPPGPFQINSKNGEVYVSSSLAGFANRQFDLLIRAVDNGEPRLSSTAPVHVKVVTRATPVFAQAQYSVSVKENVPIGAAILTVEATSPLRNKILYSISSGDNYNEFTIQFSTGAIRVNDDLDYELNRLYELTVRALDVSTGDWTDALVKINVEDVNDQTPSFERSDYFVSISEALAIGSVVISLQAADRDSGVNAQLHYRLQPTVGAERDAELFRIDGSTGAVYTRAQLDHERSPLLRFDVVATDGGSPRLSAVAHVHVALLDVNDSPPQFDELAYRATLSGASQRGQLVAMVTATDADSSDSGRLAYAIVSGNSRRSFTVNPLTGAVTVSALHDPLRLDAGTYTLNISATDGLHASFVPLIAIVQRPNQFAPRFQRAQYNLAVPENMAAGTGIGFVRAVDDDASAEDASDIVYSIIGEQQLAYFRIDPRTGELSLARPLDFERRQLYQLQLEARDGGSRAGFASVYVSVTDVNDERPLFKCEDYRVAVPLTISAGSVITQVSAVDLDGLKAASSRIRYEMIASDGLSTSLFTVEPSSGVIRSLQDLGTYGGQTIQFYVHAVDGSPGAVAALQSASHAVVSVYVMREAEQAPHFVDREAKAHINESTAPGAVIKRLSAVMSSGAAAAATTAADGAHLRYRIVSGMTEETNRLGTFSIGSEDGVVTLVLPLDAETVSNYELTIEVALTDPSQPLAQLPMGPSLVARTKLQVQIFDDNDNVPVFSSTTYSAPVPEDIVPGTKILQLYAEDADIDNRIGLGYSLAAESSDLSGTFMVDSNGAIFMLAPVDRETTAQYKLKVVVSDQDWRGRPLTSTATVLVQVIDVNDEPPRFTNIIQEVAVHEDAPVGTIVVQLHTEDDDLPDNTQVAFSITDGNSLGHFRVRNQGEIYVNKPLDRESNPKYDLEVAASDGVFVTKVRLVISILDSNDNAPLCYQPLYTSVMPESVAASSHVLQVQAKDLDEPGMPHSKITYSLSGDSSDDFIVDANTGDIQVRRELDRERVANYRLTARAEDGGGLYCLMDVAVLLTDVNDNDPVFDQSEYQWTLPEDSPNNTLLMRVSATDKDSGMNRKIGYHLSHGGDGRFAIDERSGIVRVTGSLRREVAQQYVLTVGAMDHGSPRRTAYATFTVDIADVNDPPRFELSIYEQHLREDTPIGTIVMSVRATSADTGPNNVVTYRIADAGADASLFTLDKTTGVLRTAGTFDYERVREYVLTVEAKDDGEPPLSDHASVKIHITDSNDNAPQFSQPSYSAQVREDARLREQVIRVQATDADSGINSALTYTIIAGDELKQFAVDKTSGHIVVAASLDREAIAKYTLIVRAEDGGFPSRSSTVNVDLQVVDVNDNPPRFSQSNYTAVLQEGKNTAYSPLRLDVTDADAPPNNGPFEFSIVSDAADKFEIRGDGSLLAPGTFWRAEQSEYTLVIRVSDGGTPPLATEATVVVRIVEATLQPPELAPVILFNVRTFEGPFPAGGHLGTVLASDPDGDLLMFSIAHASPTAVAGGSPIAASSTVDTRKLFSVDAQRGIITAVSALDEGRYTAAVSVSDGRFTAVGQIEVIVSSISPRLLAEALSVRLVGVDIADFVGIHQLPFARAVREVTPVPLAAVHILAVQSVSSGATPSSTSSVLLPPRSRRSDATGSAAAAAPLPAAAPQTLTTSPPAVIEVLIALERMSDRGAVPRDQLRSIVDTQRSTIESIMGGSLRLDPTSADGGPCSQRPSSSLPSSSPAAAAAPCRDDERCVVDHRLDDSPVVIASQKESFASFGFKAVARCVCNADSCSNPCQSNPCPTHKVCRPLMSSSANQFACECPENRFGADCKVRTGDPLAFTGMSYAVWELTNSIERRMRLTLRFRTMQKDAVLMDARGKVDFSVLEIEDGKLQYRFECGSGVGKLRVENVAVDDGRWHTVDVERTGNFAKLVLDIPYTVQAYAPGTTDVINLSNKDVYFGGTPKGRDNVERGFRGCMSDIRLESDAKVEGDLLLPYGKPNGVGAVKKFQHIQFGCNKIGHCEPNPCLNDGICLESTGGSTCSCKGYTGAQCEYDLDECSKNPCLNGGVCTNLVGSFQCDCAAGFSGGVCEVPANGKDQLPGTIGGITLGTMEIIVIAASACGLLLIAFVVAVVIRCAISRKRRQADIGRGHQTPSMPTVAPTHKLGSTDIFRPQSSLSLAEDEGDLHSPEPPSIPPRPTSYTSSVHEGAGRPNNYERVRSYGSAAEGLENLPNMSVFTPAFMQCVENTKPPAGAYASVAPGLPAVPSSAAASDTDSIQKPLYEFDYPNIYGSPATSSFRPGPDVQRHREPAVGPRYRKDDSIASLSATELDDEAYHWDTSDWEPRRGMPASRRPPMGRSGHAAKPSHHHLYPAGYQSSDVGEDSEYVGEDSDLDDELLFPPPPPPHAAVVGGGVPQSQGYLSGHRREDEDDDAALPQFHLPLLQPSQYLPVHRAPSAGGDSEHSGSGSGAAGREPRRPAPQPDYKGRAFVPLLLHGSSPAVPKRSASLLGARGGDYSRGGAAAAAGAADDMSSIAGGGGRDEYSDSDSDMSGICEIESDYEPNVAGIIPTPRAPSHTDV